MIVFQYTAYFNGQETAQVFNSVAAILGSSSDFMGLVKAVGIGGFLAVCITALMKIDGKEIFPYFIALALVQAVLMAPVGRVVITDRSGSPVTNTVVVDNVPLGVAFAASELNHVGVFLTNLYETNFTAADAPRFSSTGMMFGARMYDRLLKVNVPDTGVARDMMQFMERCVNPELADYPQNASRLQKSGDLVTDLFNNGLGILNPGRSMLMSNATDPGAPVEGSAMNCTAAGTKFKAYFDDASKVANPILDKLGPLLNIVGPKDAAAGQAVIRNYVARTIEGGSSYLLGESMTAQRQINQAVAMQMFLNAQADVASLNGNDNAGSIGAAVMARRQIEEQSSLSRTLAEEILPRIRSMVEYVCIAIFPVVLLVMIAAGAKAMLVMRSYFGVLLSINLWPPLYAIISYMLTTSSTKFKMMAAKGDDVVNGTMALANMDALRGIALSDQAIGGMLVMAVPAIALALVKGGEVALNSAIGGVTGAASGAASSAASTAAQGNFQYGNFGSGQVGMNTANIGQYNRSARVDAGATTITMGGQSRSVMQGPDGSIETISNSSGLRNVASGGVQAAAGEAYRSGLQAQARVAALERTGASAELSNASSNILKASGGRNGQVGTSGAFGTDFGQQVAAAGQRAVEAGTAVARKATESVSSGLLQTANFSLGGNIGAHLGKLGQFLGKAADAIDAKSRGDADAFTRAGISPGAQLALQGSSSADLRQQAQRANEASTNQLVKDASNINTGSSAGVSLKIGSGASEQTVAAAGRDVQRVMGAAEKLDRATSQEKAVSRAMSQESSSDGSVSRDLVDKAFRDNPGLHALPARQQQDAVVAAVQAGLRRDFGTQAPQPNQGVGGQVDAGLQAAEAATKGAPQLNTGNPVAAGVSGSEDARVTALSETSVGRVPGRITVASLPSIQGPDGNTTSASGFAGQTQANIDKVRSNVGSDAGRVQSASQERFSDAQGRITEAGDAGALGNEATLRGLRAAGEGSAAPVLPLFNINSTKDQDESAALFNKGQAQELSVSQQPYSPAAAARARPGKSGQK